MATASIILPPNAARLIEGLRDTGYDLNTAIADIVDNSVDAGANKINVYIGLEADNEILIAVSDNGCGMDENGLLNGMTYGAVGKFDSKRLGKFGLGLKTASTAFARKLSVITRPAYGAELHKAVWDLDHIVENDIWELLRPDPDQTEIELFNEVASSSSGTLVVWSKVDRLLKMTATSNSKSLKKSLDKIINSFHKHAGMVYQRFLDKNDTRARNIDINLNGLPIEPWDPFCTKEPETSLVANETIPVEFEDNRNAKFNIKAYIIPRREQFSTAEAATTAMVQNNMQGIYIYRENRLIHFADWLGMYRQEPHITLLRIEFSFDHDLDEAFQVDIKKSQIILNDDLYNYVKENFLPAPRNAADERSRKGQRKAVIEMTKFAHVSSNRTISSQESSVVSSKVEVIDTASSQVQVTNKFGQSSMKIKISHSINPDEVFVKAEDSLDDGFLWLPGLIDGHHSVLINKSHPYYHKVYVPNLSSDVTIQGLDSLLWALIEAEFSTMNNETKRHFTDLRLEVSRILRTLVENLPEPETEQSDDRHR
ncbi:MAG: ATP-binding protein [Saprospiraceae bacterium]